MKGLAVALLLLLSACHSTGAFRYGDDVGIAVEKAGHPCLYISNVSPGQRVRFVTASAPQTSGEAEIVGRPDGTCQDSGQGYSLKVIRGALSRGAPAFVIANFNGPLTSTDAGITADLEGDGQSESFRTCTSSEGVHLTIWKGAPLKGLRRWHSYYYLGYDVTPDCTNSDTN